MYPPVPRSQRVHVTAVATALPAERLSDRTQLHVSNADSTRSVMLGGADVSPLNGVILTPKSTFHLNSPAALYASADLLEQVSYVEGQVVDLLILPSGTVLALAVTTANKINILRSVNAGAWVQVASLEWAANYVYNRHAVAMQTAWAGRLSTVIATRFGFYKSDDDGATWTAWGGAYDQPLYAQQLVVNGPQYTYLNPATRVLYGKAEDATGATAWTASAALPGAGRIVVLSAEHWFDIDGVTARYKGAGAGFNVPADAVVVDDDGSYNRFAFVGGGRRVVYDRQSGQVTEEVTTPGIVHDIAAQPGTGAAVETAYVTNTGITVYGRTSRADEVIPLIGTNGAVIWTGSSLVSARKDGVRSMIARINSPRAVPVHVFES